MAGRAKKIRYKYLIGIDEAGRGPLAGPVSVGAVCMLEKDARKILRQNFAGARDSKLLSEDRREEIFRTLHAHSKGGMVLYANSMVSHSVIDLRGIVHAVRLAIKRCLKKLGKLGVIPEECRVLLDGGIKAPAEYANQETIIKGDRRVPIISLASIVAKVKRDRRMKRLAKEFAGYGFEIHKGYGTKSHYEAIKKLGMSDIHRKSFLKSMNN